jgi:hypothetical protein
MTGPDDIPTLDDELAAVRGCLDAMTITLAACAGAIIALRLATTRTEHP